MTEPFKVSLEADDRLRTPLAGVQRLHLNDLRHTHDTVEDLPACMNARIARWEYR
jgi:hypothetical protein